MVTRQGDLKKLTYKRCRLSKNSAVRTTQLSYEDNEEWGVCSAQNDKSASCLNSFKFLLAAPQVSGFSLKQARETQREGRETL